jgi:hypothetical protein
MALEREDLRELVELTERQLEELVKLREQTAHQSQLLEQMLTQLASIERSQYS